MYVDVECHRFQDSRDISPNRLCKLSGCEVINCGVAHLGLMRCRAVPRMAMRMKRAADATYAQPRNGFLPPIHETVEMTKDFVPLYGRTGKSTAEIRKIGNGCWWGSTYSNRW